MDDGRIARRRLPSRSRTGRNSAATTSPTQFGARGAQHRRLVEDRRLVHVAARTRGRSVSRRARAGMAVARRAMPNTWVAVDAGPDPLPWARLLRRAYDSV